MELSQTIGLFKNKKGLELGGLSRIFKQEGALPIYTVAQTLDGCNFSSETLWEKGLVEGLNYKFYLDKVGTQFICEATRLETKIQMHSYDFVISSNCLEHSANPLLIIEKILLVLKEEGLILLVLPKKEVTFDHNREITTYEHLHSDYINAVGEDDLTHLNDILRLHDLRLDPPAGTSEQFKKRSLDNYKNRGLHQHVFDGNLLSQIFKEFDIKEICSKDIGSDYIIVGQKNNLEVNV